MNIAGAQQPSLSVNLADDKFANSNNTKSSLEKAKDIIELRKQKENTPVMGGNINAQKIREKLSDEEIQQLNESGKLPDGYALIHNPKITTHYYENGIYMGDIVTPPTYNLVKSDALPRIISLNPQIKEITDEIPKGFKIINSIDGAYIAGENVTEESLNMYLTSFIGAMDVCIRDLFHFFSNKPLSEKIFSKINK